MNVARKVQKLRNVQQPVIFVDCFNTIILRTVSNRQIFHLWSEKLAAKLEMPATVIERCYRRVNYRLSRAAFLRHFITGADLEKVLTVMQEQLKSQYPTVAEPNFVALATALYCETEIQNQTVNQPVIDFLMAQKAAGKKIYVVSDFYCPATTLRQWLENLGVLDIFDGVYSSCDYGQGKASAKLYRTLLQQLNLAGKSVLMLGDNLWSDVWMAHRRGIKTK